MLFFGHLSVQSIARLFSIVAIISFVGGCASKSVYVSSQREALELFKKPLNTSPILLGDVLRVGFYRNIRSQSQPYKINGGDLLSVNVFDHPELTVLRALVLPDGYISLPLLGRLKAEGLQVNELSDALAVAYEKQNVRVPKVNVAVMEGNYKILAMLSEMSRQGGSGQMEIKMDQRGYIDLPFIAPLYAGGKDLHQIKTEVKNAYSQVFGDTLEVSLNLAAGPARVVYVIGEVNMPGPVNYVDGMDAFRAIGAAGGLIRSAAPQRTRLVRLDGQGGYTHLNLDGNIKLDDAERLYVAPGDLIFVPKRKIVHVNQWIEEYVRNMLPVDFGVGVGYQLNND